MPPSAARSAYTVWPAAAYTAPLPTAQPETGALLPVNVHAAVPPGRSAYRVPPPAT